jgi:aryl-alcohol dehydrogenase-like predicted oxidoreductase
MSILYKSKVKIFARSCFLQGLLVENNSSSKIKKKYFNYFNEFNTWCKTNKISQLEACINFVRQFNQINFLVVGVNSFDQFYKILDVLRKKKVSITKKFMTNNLNLIDPRKWS